MAIFDYALRNTNGVVQRISRARAKGVVMRGNLEEGERVIVSRRDPPETRELSADELHQHFDLIATGVEDPFLQMASTTVSATNIAPPAADPEPPKAAPPHQAPPKSEPEPAPKAAPTSTPPAEAPPAARPLTAPEPPRAAEPTADPEPTAEPPAAPTLAPTELEPAKPAPAPTPPAEEPRAARPITPPEPAQATESAADPEPPAESPTPPTPAQMTLEPTKPAPAPEEPPVAPQTDQPSTTAGAPARPVRQPKAPRKPPQPSPRPEAAPASEPVTRLVEKTSPRTGGGGLSSQTPGANAEDTPPTRPSSDPKQRKTPVKASVRSRRSSGKLPKSAIFVGLGVILLGVIAGAIGWFLGLERQGPLYAQASGAVAHVAADEDADVLALIEPGQRLTVTSGGPDAPPSGWVRIETPLEAAGGFARLDDTLSRTPMPETVSTLFALGQVSVHALADADSVAMMSIADGQPVTAVTSGGAEPPTSGWVRIVEPADLQGQFALRSMFADSAPPEAIEPRFALAGAFVAAEPSDTSEPLAGFSAGERLVVVTGGGETPPPAGWARIVEPANFAGLYAPLDALDAASPALADGRYYVAQATDAFADVLETSGEPLALGSALHIVTSGGDTPPPPGWGLIQSPAEFAGRFVSLANVASVPLEEERSLFYAVSAITLEDAPPPTALALIDAVEAPLTDPEQTESEPIDATTDEPALIEVAAGEQLEVVVRGGEWGPPAGWGVIMTPERAAGHWVDLSLLSAEPLEASISTYYAAQRIGLLSEPSTDAEVVSNLARGQQLTVLTIGGPNPPPTGWGRLVEPETLADTYVPLADLSEEPLSEVRAEMYAVTSLDYYSEADKRSELRGALPRGTAMTVIRSGGETSPPDGWMLVVEPAPAAGSFIEAGLVARSEREPLESRVEELWEVVAQTPLQAEPEENDDVLATMNVGEVVYVVGQVKGSWFEIRQGAGRIGYLPGSAFLNEPSAPDLSLQTGADALSEFESIDQTWWATEDAPIFLLPDDTGERLGSLVSGEEVYVNARHNGSWLQVEYGGISGFVTDAAVSPEQPAVVVPARLLQSPSARDMERAYPRRAFSQDLSGTVVLECAVALNSEADCQVVSETPPDAGFGDAALSLVPRMRFQPETRDGLPVAGGLMRLGLEFQTVE